MTGLDQTLLRVLLAIGLSVVVAALFYFTLMGL
jgi:hypothetical protein